VSAKGHPPWWPSNEQQSTFSQKPPHLPQSLLFSGNVFDDVFQHDQVKSPSKFGGNGWVEYVFGPKFHSALIDVGRHDSLSFPDLLFVEVDSYTIRTCLGKGHEVAPFSASEF
jgi:hypothetical protein